MAKDSFIELLVITPERRVVAETTTSVVLPLHDGELGVLRDRAPLMAELGIGQLRYDEGGKTRQVFVDGGFAQIADNRVMVLAPRALRADEISDETISAAESRMTAADLTGEQRMTERRRLGALRSVRPRRP